MLVIRKTGLRRGGAAGQLLIKRDEKGLRKGGGAVGDQRDETFEERWWGSW